MNTVHPKSVRRRLLQIAYERYMLDPLDMLPPEVFLEDGTVSRADLLANMYYLHDRGLIELMTGYNPPMFAAARATADGIDLVENDYEFNLRFPAAPGEVEYRASSVPELIEQLVQEAEAAPLDGEARKCLLRDVQYLRDELARPADRWRIAVVRTVLAWLEAAAAEAESELPSLKALEDAVSRALEPQDADSAR